MIRFFDSHAHLDDSRIQNEYAGGTDALINDCFNTNICGIINVSTNLENSEASVGISAKYEKVWAGVGIYPTDAQYIDDEKYTKDRLEKIIKMPKVVAVGEIGLDYHYEDTDKEKQKYWFEVQMKIAEKYDLPVIIHDRDAHGDCMEIIKKYPSVKGVFHSFSGSAEMAKELTETGWYVSFSGPVTYKNAIRPKEACKCVPLDRILIETDSPYLPPEPHRGKMNIPSYVEFSAKEIAKQRGISVREIALQTEENAKRLFRINY